MMKIKKVTFLSVLGAALFFSAPVFAADAPAPAKVVNVSGDVQVKDAPGSGWTGAQEGTQVQQGGEVLTNADSTCDLAIGEGQASTIRLNPNSRAVLNSIDPAKVDLQSGKLFALVRGLKKGSAFQVSTPTAVASARGTGFTAEPSAIKVFEDSVDVEGKAGADPTVGEGQGIGTNSDGTLGDTFGLTDEDWEDWDKFLSEVEGEGSGEDEDEFGGLSEEGAEADDEKDIDDSLEPEEPQEERGQEEQFTE
ncbi:MAG: FecR domain-containing protein [Candidatus Omnitrophota bacterium]